MDNKITESVAAIQNLLGQLTFLASEDRQKVVEQFNVNNRTRIKLEIGEGNTMRLTDELTGVTSEITESEIKG